MPTNENRASRAAARAWLHESQFNLLMDYWTFAVGRPYGSGCTRDNVLPALRQIRPGFLVIYAKGETGHTSFRSVLRSEHPGLARNLPRFFRRVTRETGTRLFLYYSGLEDGVAARSHPGWRLIGEDGKPVVFFREFTPPGVSCSVMCPQSPYLEKWVAVHLREMIECGDPDGIWVDGTWVGPCYCPRCVGGYRAATGFRGKRPEGLEWSRYWAGVQRDFRQRFLDILRDLKPTCLGSFGNITVRREFREDRDWCSGDWYSPNNNRICQSIVARRYTTTGLPYDAKTCDTQMVHSLLRFRPRTKPLCRMLQEGAGLLANGALWTYWTFPMGHGALVPSRMRQAAAAARFARERRDISLGTRSVGWTTVLDLEPNHRLWGPGVWGAAKALIDLHRSPDVMDEERLCDDMPYELVVVAEQPSIPAGVVARLEAFVRRGGKLLSTGASIQSHALQRLLGVRLNRASALDDGHVRRRDGGFTGVWAAWDRLELAGARELYPLFLSWDQFNPRMKHIPQNIAITGLVDENRPQRAGMPAATIRRLGRGLAVHIPTDLFRVYWSYGYPDVKAWLGEILDGLQPEPLFRTDAPSWIEVALRKRGDALLVHFVNGNPGRDLSQVATEDLWVDEIPPVGPYSCWIRCAVRPRRVTCEPGGRPAPARWRNGLLETQIPRFEIHTCLKIESWRDKELSHPPRGPAAGEMPRRKSSRS